MKPPLTPERWRILEPLLDAALEVPAERRPAVVAELAGSDHALRDEVLALLEDGSESGAVPLLSRPASEVFHALGEAEPLFRLEGNQAPQDWTPDGRLIVREIVEGRGHDLLTLTFEDDSVRVIPYLTDGWDENRARISPDGRWLAYTATETGRAEVFVRPYPDRETVLSAPERLAGATVANYDIHPDGERFLIVRSAGAAGEATARITVAANWFEELKARLATSAAGGPR